MSWFSYAIIFVLNPRIAAQIDLVLSFHFCFSFCALLDFCF